MALCGQHLLAVNTGLGWVQPQQGERACGAQRSGQCGSLPQLDCGGASYHATPGVRVAILLAYALSSHPHPCTLTLLPATQLIVCFLHVHFCLAMHVFHAIR